MRKLGIIIGFGCDLIWCDSKLKRVFLLTGNPGIGKTTVLIETVDALRAAGFIVGGMVSREVRETGIRVGFEVSDLSTAKRGWLARVNQTAGPRVGKYRVDLEDLNSVGAAAIESAVDEACVVVIDEVGPMELFSDRFKRAVLKAVLSDRIILGVLHQRAKDRLIEKMRSREDVEIIVVSEENRDRLPGALVQRVVDSRLKTG